MKKSELKNIAGYLPYDLHVQYTFNGTKRTCSIYSVRKGATNYLFDLIETRKDKAHNELHAIIYEIKPILRPLSDLYKTITHNGKEIIPIVECAKIHNPQLEWEHNKYTAFSQLLEFSYDYDFGFFCYFSDEKCHVNNQYQLFDYLHELKIDYRNLIDKGLAIDANTLETNPYK